MKSLAAIGQGESAGRYTGGPDSARTLLKSVGKDTSNHSSISSHPLILFSFCFSFLKLKTCSPLSVRTFACSYISFSPISLSLLYEYP